MAQRKALQGQFNEKIKIFASQNDELKVAVTGFLQSLQRVCNLSAPDFPPIAELLGKQEESSSSSMERISDGLAVGNITSQEDAARGLYNEVKDKCKK